MSIDKNPEVKLFGFRISKTGTIILAFVTLILFLQYIPQVYYTGQSIVYFFINYTIPEILANLDNIIQGVIGFLIPLTLVSLFIIIFIFCTKMQKSFRSEDIYVKWFSYRLTKTSIAVLFILSLVYLIMNSFDLYNYVNNFIYMIPHMPIQYAIFYIVLIVAALISMVVSIYTLIICVKNRETLV